MEEGNALVIVDVIVELLLISGMCPKVVCHVHEPWNFPLLMVTSSLGRKRPNCYEKMSQGSNFFRIIVHEKEIEDGTLTVKRINP